MNLTSNPRTEVTSSSEKRNIFQVDMNPTWLDPSPTKEYVQGTFPVDERVSD